MLKTLEGLAQGDRDLRRGTALVEVQPRHPVAWVGGDVGGRRRALKISLDSPKLDLQRRYKHDTRESLNKFP